MPSPRGRPRETPGVILSKQIAIRFSPPEARRLAALAKVHGMTTGELLRWYARRVIALLDKLPNP